MAERILVTGGAGYIGSVVVAHLRKAGYQTTCLDTMGQGRPKDADPDCVVGDYRDWLDQGFLGQHEWVVHLAGHSSVGMCKHDPHGAYHNNVSGFVDLLKARQGRKLIYASSVSVYGDTGFYEAAECHSLPTPKNHYDANKQDIDRYAALFGGENWGLRFGTVCGWSPNLREDLLMNSMAMSAARDGVVRVANPKANRPILGINDLARAVEHIVRGKVRPGVYNLLTKNVTMEEMAEEVSMICRARLEVTQMPNSYNIVATADKFKGEGGFEFTDWTNELAHCVYFGWNQCVRTGRRDGGWVHTG